uniref:Uncharacterized protein n=1 Tax=Arundo donax TaxID=35708 RepID=A0A0A9GAZ4_ARUDO
MISSRKLIKEMLPKVRSLMLSVPCKIQKMALASHKEHHMILPTLLSQDII